MVKRRRKKLYPAFLFPFSIFRLWWAFFLKKIIEYLSLKFRKRTFANVRPVKIQISLRIRAVWSESSLCAFLDSKGYNISSRGQRRLWSDCKDTLADLCHSCAHMSECTFSHVLAQLIPPALRIPPRTTPAIITKWQASRFGNTYEPNMHKNVCVPK